jgi:hypothetical protein
MAGWKLLPVFPKATLVLYFPCGKNAASTTWIAIFEDGDEYDRLWSGIRLD